MLKEIKIIFLLILVLNSTLYPANTDSLQVKTHKKITVKYNGNISLGYEYGLIPFLLNENLPAGYFKTEGNFSFSAFKIPLLVSYYYTDLKNVNGLNSYFRISLDVNSLKDNANAKVQAKKDQLLVERNKLNALRQQSIQKLMYYQYVLNHPNPPIYNLNTLSTQNPLDTLQFNYNLPDSLNTLALPQIQNDLPLDSLKLKLQHWQNKLDDLNNSIQTIEKQLENLNKYEELKNKNVHLNTEQLKPHEKMLMGFQRFDIGLCSPDNSFFLTNGIVLKGISTEWQQNHIYASFAYGTTINNLLFSNNLIQNNLQLTRNLYNFFDFNSLQSGRRILSAKTGYGTKEGNHIFVGILYGKGLQSYYTSDSLDNNTLLQTSGVKERNYVFEIDARFKPAKNQSIDFAHGRSLLQTQDAETKAFFPVLNNWFDANNRSYAYLLRYTLHINKTGTQLSTTGRMVYPYFRSYGVGFMRSDNLRYEVKVQQQLGKKVKLQLFYRSEEDNLLNLYNYQTYIKMYGANITWRISRNWMARAGYSPVIQAVKTNDNSYHFKNNNNITHALLSYTKNSKNLKTNISALYNYYYLYNGHTNRLFWNTGIICSNQYKKMQNNFSVNYFYGGADSVSNTFSTIVSDEFSLSLKNGFRITAIGRYTHHSLYGHQPGYGLKILASITKKIMFEAAGERVVLGDFYNSFNIEQIKKFPYFFSGRFIVNF